MKCIFTNEIPDSEEHVFPRWLQKRFNLENQTLVLPNATTLRYRHHKVPAQTAANGLFGQIEDRISQGHLDPAEIYLWALKLHIGCIYRDGTLKMDIKSPTSAMILDTSDFSQDVWLFQQLFDIWKQKGSTSPSPIGSVFIVDSLFAKPDFDFMHCLITGTVAINIGTKFIMVLLFDQADAMRANFLDIWEKWHVRSVAARHGQPDYHDHCYIAHHVWACECAYGAYRRRRPFNVIRAPDNLTLVPPMSRIQGRPPEEAEYRQVCRNFGLNLVKYGGEIGNVYEPAKFMHV